MNYGSWEGEVTKNDCGSHAQHIPRPQFQAHSRHERDKRPNLLLQESNVNGDNVDPAGAAMRGSCYPSLPIDYASLPKKLPSPH